MLVQHTAPAIADGILDDATVEELRKRLGGRLLRPGENGYEEARRVWNGRTDKRPAMIARCSGGNFGVATSFRYRLYPLGTVWGGMVLHPISAAREVLRSYRDFTATAPDELTAYAGFMTSPDGHPLVAIILCYSGDLAAGEQVLEPVRRFGSPVADLIQPMPYTAQQSLLDAGVPAGQHSYWKARQLSALTDDENDRVREAYGVNYERLVAVKDRYDPTNFFRYNHDIVPSGQRQRRPSRPGPSAGKDLVG